MIRPTALCAAIALLLTACAADTTNPNATGTAGYGTGGISNAGLSGGPGGRGAPGSQQDLTQSAGDRIYFETDQSLVTPESRATLDRQAQWLQSNPGVSVWVAGNCDERGTEEYNLALGQRRADADRDYLASRGIDTRRLATISYGKSRPIDPSSNQEAWAHDRNAITSVR
ncbi:MAG: OmpA family protein [Acetobacteraceae bacterium]|jgi:peptidoglycan-associated lipoprotein